jgi:hypothetical protein
MSRLGCVLRCHVDSVRVSPGRLAVECSRCGRLTAGVEIGPRRVRQVLPGKKRRHARAKALQMAWLAWQAVER